MSASKRFLFSIFALCIVIVSIANFQNVEASGGRIVAYYPAWAIYARHFFITDINPMSISHLNYAFANIGSDFTIQLGDAWADTQYSYPGDKWDDPLRGNFKQLIILKQKNPNLKTLISVGGWTWSSTFSTLASTDANRKTFAASVVTFVKQYQFDGIDIDWEYPVTGGNGIPHRPDDAINLTLLLAELRNQLGPNYLITIASGAASSVYQNYQFKQLSGILNWINLMSYDYHGSFDATTNFNAPLHSAAGDPTPNFNVDSSVQGYLAAGFNSNQLVMGIPLYGRCWANVPSTNNGLYQPGPSGCTGTWEAGVLDYTDIRDNYIGKNGYVQYFDTQAQVPYLYSPTQKVFISYDDMNSVAAKANYINNNKLGGAMVWDLSSDRSGQLVGVLDNAIKPFNSDPVVLTE